MPNPHRSVQTRMETRMNFLVSQGFHRKSAQFYVQMEMHFHAKKMSHPSWYYSDINLIGGTNMEQINSTNHCCATCAYWLGRRAPHRLGFVEVVSKMDGGRCGTKGLNDSRQYQAVYSCSKYRKWQALR